jgi:hypothetical protein
MLKNEEEKAPRVLLLQRMEELYTKITLHDCVRARHLLDET